MNKTMKYFMVLAFLLGNKGYSTDGPMVAYDVHREIEKTKQTLASLEKSLSLNQEGENEIFIDYRRRRINDFDDSFCLHYQNLGGILEQLRALRTDKPIRVDFAENYLTDKSVEEVVKFILEHDYIKRNLKELDLSNNRFTKVGLVGLKELVELRWFLFTRQFFALK